MSGGPRNPSDTRQLLEELAELLERLLHDRKALTDDITLLRRHQRQLLKEDSAR